MRFRDEITLIAVKRSVDADGYVTAETESSTYVFADVMSIRRSEFYESLRSGVRMAIAFKVRICDYNNEERVKYNGKTYKVERTYTSDGEMIELNCSEMNVNTG